MRPRRRASALHRDALALWRGAALADVLVTPRALARAARFDAVRAGRARGVDRRAAARRRVRARRLRSRGGVSVHREAVGRAADARALRRGAPQGDVRRLSPSERAPGGVRTADAQALPAAPAPRLRTAGGPPVPPAQSKYA